MVVYLPDLIVHPCFSSSPVEKKPRAACASIDRGPVSRNLAMEFSDHNAAEKGPHVKWKISGLGGLRSPASLTLSRRPFELSTRALTANPPSWIQTNSATPRRTKPAGLIESCIVMGIIIHHYDTSV